MTTTGTCVIAKAFVGAMLTGFVAVCLHLALPMVGRQTAAWADPRGARQPGAEAAGLPRIQVSDSLLHFVARRHGPLPANQSFMLINQTGVGIMDWMILTDRAWLGASPSSGRSNEQEIQVWMSHTNVPIGAHMGRLVITSTNAVNAPETVFVTLDMLCPIAITGDVNNDGVINQTDIIYLVIHVAKNGPPPLPVSQAGDVNCDGRLSLTDVIYIVIVVFKQGPPPCDACTML